MVKKSKFSLGLDFGTESVRAVLIDVDTGQVAASSICPYADGVIDRVLPGSQIPLPPDYALQNPADWMSGLELTIREVLKQSQVAREAVVGLGIDFTACTVLPTTAGGVPLCQLEACRDNPHAWVKLWKHHAAQSQADRVNEVARQRGEAWLALYGGRISSEWVLPKALQLYQEAPEVYHAAGFILEGADWVGWQLTGNLARNACGAGYKATWHKSQGYPAPAFLEALAPGFGCFYADKFAGEVVAPGTCTGGLTQVWASRLGLPVGLPVAAGMIDAHASMIGAGITSPGAMFLIMGTSTCHMLMGEKEELVPGISGVVWDGIVPGLYGYEAGQAGVGDIFAWFVETCVPPTYHDEAKVRGISLHDLLSEKAGRLAPGQSGLIALDWWNGCRTPLVDARLSGLLVGATLSTTPEEIYRALIEATAFGTRLIIRAFTGQGIPVDRLLAGGGLTKNSLLLQLYADITGYVIGVVGTTEVSALGAAMLGTVAAGPAGGGYTSLSQAANRMAPPFARLYQPRRDSIAAYRELYDQYTRLVDIFGRVENSIMDKLRRIRHESLSTRLGCA